MTAKVYTAKEVGELLGVSRQTVDRLIAAGEIASLNVGSELRPRKRITEDALDDFKKARTNVA